ncbi:hypothetical protein EUX98_g1125 [Antrodiella citrinella]|uniref:Uncharacterized protein n=1 Tax=Antrodiella citrinella TaxID=2447956 RepID=A0A4S4N289_9APHY|nr:hypothetical protein EUX98_g1125 [Antrodiella citrinella]
MNASTSFVASNYMNADDQLTQLLQSMSLAGPWTSTFAVQDQLDADLFPTTNGVYLDLIFTHREAFYTFPQGHQLCALGFSEIAKKVEMRKWRVDREGDNEAVNAFRNEAWIIANA